MLIFPGPQYAEPLENLAFPDTPLIAKTLKNHLCKLQHSMQEVLS